jgi:hypothetical protein
MKEQLASATGLGNIYANINSGLTVSQAIFKEYASNATELLKTVLQANAEYAKATGELAEDKRPVLFANNLNQFGIGFEKMNKASIDLFKSMNNFSNQTADVREELAATAAKLDLLGISASTTGKTLESLTLGMKMSTTEAINTTNEMARAAIGAGIAPQKMADEFAANIGKLAAYGKQGVQVYIDMQKQAKSLGVELNTLNGIVGDQFDTFEGAARAAGKLNAVLGGNYLNSVEMLNATESERILILKRSFDESGKNFDALSKYEKKAVAATLGITDLNEASKLFGKSTTDLTMDMEKQSATQDKLNQIMRNAATIGDKMKEFFTVFAPLVRAVAFVIELLVNIITFLNSISGGFLSVLTSLITGFIALNLVIGGSLFEKISKLGGLFKDMGKSVVDYVKNLSLFKKGTEEAAEASGKASGGLAESIKKIGSAAAESGKGLVYLGGAIALIGIGIGAAAFGLAQLVAAFKGLTGEQMLGALGSLVIVLGSFIVMIGILSIVSAKAALPMLALGFAFVLIGGGIALAAVGIKEMVIQLVALSSSMSTENIAKLAAFSGAIMLLATAFSTIGASSIFALVGLTFITASIFSISAAINNLEIDKLNGFSSSMENFLNLLKFEGIKESASAIAISINEIAAAMENIPEGKTTSLQTLNETLNVAKTITEDNIKPTKDFINVIKEYYQFQADSKEADKDALVQALKEVTKTFATTEKEREITLVIKGNEVAALLKGEKTTMQGLLTGFSPVR